MLEKRYKPFIGVEAEGPWRGRSTLFLPGSLTFAEVKKALKAVPDDTFLYIGAGNNFDFKNDLVGWSWLFNNHSTYKTKGSPLETFRLIVEFDRRDSLGIIPPFGTETITRRMADIWEDRRYHVRYYKSVCDDFIVLNSVAMDKPYVTRLDDPLYQQDKEIW